MNMFSKRNGILIGQVAVITGILFGNILLIMAGALVLANEYKDKWEEKE